MDAPGAKTPRRKRARIETNNATAVTPPPFRASPSERSQPSSANDDGARVVWRDSPADKHIRVSGTGKLAQQQEVRGFVGRLANLQSPPTGDHAGVGESPIDYERGCSINEQKNNTAHQGTKRKALTRLIPVMGINGAPQPETTAAGAEVSSVSRHILFSPESDGGKSSESSSTVNRGPRQSTSPWSSRGDSQDDLLLIDQIDARLSSELSDGSQATPVLPALQNNGTQPSTAPTAPGSAGTASSAYVTPPRHPNTVAQPNVNASSTVIENKLEFESPDFTEESWELLDQLEFEATQQRGLSQLTQAENDSHQVLPPAPPPAPRPLRSGGHSSMTKPPVSDPQAPVLVASAASRASTAVDKRLVFDDVELSAPTGSQQASSQSNGNTIKTGNTQQFKRLLVLEVDRDDYNRRMSLRLLDEEDLHMEVDLLEDWYETGVEAGDTIHLIFSDRGADGFFSQSASASGTSSQRIFVNNDQNLVIAHPDILVSPTSVTSSFGCLRRAVLKETLNVSRPTNQKALLGTLKHELFQHALVAGSDHVSGMLADAERVISAHALDLIESGLSEETATFELSRVMQDYQKWLVDSRVGNVLLNEPASSTGNKLLVRQILSVEEMLWSVKWGVKGSIDATVEASFSGQQQQRQVLPLELKTGSKAYGGVEHQGQVILYTLLLGDRYQQQCKDGILMYVPGIETNRIAAMASHVRGLVIARNKFASAMARVKALGSSTTSSHQQQALPPMLGRRRDCERCFQIDECVLHHAAVENGSAESSALEDLFHTKVGHLAEEDLAYFRKWNRLIDLEHQNADKHLRSLWLQTGAQQERDPESSCIAQLRLASDEAAARGGRGSATMRAMTFQRDRRSATDLRARSFLERRFRVEDRIIISTESLDEKNLLVHISRGKITALTRDTIQVESFQAVPSIVLEGRSVVGAEFTWRLDKDTISSGLSRAKEHLVKLLIGPVPENVTQGTDPQLRPDLLANGVSQGLHASSSQQQQRDVGDVRRRRLIVHLLKPRFRSFRFVDMLLHRQSKLDPSLPQGTLCGLALQLHEDFAQLNLDQQQAVAKVVNSLDYALVLGMPGTGKTSTIAFTVRVLVFLGFSVLITSYTHSAVDNLLLKLRGHIQLSMLRIGNLTQVHPEVAPYTLENLVGENARVAAVEAQIQRANVVGCTCLGVSNHVLFAKRRFDFCIVDEATQTTEPVLLGPLRCADTFVLVGDHYQLPPLVTNLQAKKEGMDISLFRRLSEAHPEATQQLTYQYRMNRDVMLVANRLVYGNKLKCGSNSVATNKLSLKLPPTMFKSASPLWPLEALAAATGVCFVNTDGMPMVSETAAAAGQGNTRGRKLENQVEARIVTGLVQVLIAGAVTREEIAVISPFRSQVALIQNELSRVVDDAASDGVEVSTIDKYQGKDKDVVIVSFVRSNSENQVGALLTDWRRINVVLTRAKQKLVLIGSKRTLRAGSGLFHVLMQLIDEKRWEIPLHRDAIAMLDAVNNQLRSLAASRATVVPSREPEREPSVYIHRQCSAEIEDTMATALPLRRHPHHVDPPRPVTRDVMGEYRRR